MLPLAIAALAFSAVTANSAELTGRLKTIQDRNFITVAYRESSVPFSYLGSNAEPIGYAQEICGKVVDEIKKVVGRPNLEIRRQAVTSQNRIPLMQNGTIDLECGSTVNNPERQAQVSFSTTYFVVGAKFVALKSSNLHTLKDLKGKTVVATTGSNTVPRIRRIDRAEHLDLNLIQAKDFSDSMLTFTSGRAEAFFEDDINLVGQIAFTLNPANYTLSTDTLSKDPYAIMLPRGEAEFKAIADKTIEKLYASGEIKALYAKWFQSPIPPRGVNLNFPMSEALLKVIAKPTDSPNPADY
ncbi:MULTISPECIES: amino acid ABC transporter substrate-binding protein [unclassified Variovorax]|uniref:amino acid ABC transporter substrate-binding protein n=1 Tax=unclassified Variovorax TaxID=663243 RepID=UPI002577E6D0|nr:MULTISPECIES: amino acid ABC transporter substrate-binding protein [unclassified Variovorax]MDM0087417.1 amino acid ABC transporter substrate-binding protein [Variovorax sp. J22G40]MDM0144326.1 amino acid ABC transporter substrate-binding protein [Variovorax sp. J2P1-31]